MITGWDRIYRKEFLVGKEDAVRFFELDSSTYRRSSLS